MEEERKTRTEEQAAGIGHFPDEEDLEITSVEKLRKPKHRYRIAFGPYVMSVHEDVMLKYRMLKGNTFRKEELQDIVVADERQRAYVDALQHLSRKPRTSQEIVLRLQQKGYDPEQIELTVRRLESEQLIDDALYAKMWAEQRMTGHKKGRLWVKQELRQKGIDAGLIADALSEVSPEEELESALAVARKKWQQTKGETMDRKRKTGAYLMRRGFSGAQASQALRRIMDEEREQGSWDDDFEGYE